MDAADDIPTPAVNAVPAGHGSSTPVSDDYYQTVVITALLGILKDQSLSSQHHAVIEAVMSIFKTQGLKCVTFLPQVSSSWGTFHVGRLYILLTLDYTGIRCRNQVIHSQAARISFAAISNPCQYHQAAYSELHA